jgi:hypothetical protein
MEEKAKRKFEKRRMHMRQRKEEKQRVQEKKNKKGAKSVPVGLVVDPPV